MKNEIWKDVLGYDGLYQVSNLGNVRSLFYRGRNKVQVIKQSEDGSGYMQVVLFKNGKRKTHHVHRLVAVAFVPNHNNYPQVNHINEDKTDNRAENLEWCSISYNVNYGKRNKLASRKMTNHPSTSKQIVQLTKEGDIVRVYPSTREAARFTGWSQGTLADCARGVRKQAYNYVWKYN